jgi:hypothetical protein
MKKLVVLLYQPEIGKPANLNECNLFQQLHPLGSKRHRYNFLPTANLP